MFELAIKEINSAVHGQILQGSSLKGVKGVSIDSRGVIKDNLFIAIQGVNHDGHDFIEEAIANGAAAILIHRDVTLKNKIIPVIRVADTRKALQGLAHYYRKRLKGLKVVAVTGSAGKTTTKDMIATLLKESYQTTKTRGNLNNYYGLPLSILGLEGNEEIAVLEMGMSELGEIALLADIAQPDIGVITNVGATHLESLESIENVARGKSELIKGLPTTGIAVLNYDNPYVREMKVVFAGQKIIYYGLNNKADLYADNIEQQQQGIKFDLHYQGEKHRLQLNKPGEHNLYNALAAIAVAREFSISWGEIKGALTELDFSALRWDVRQWIKGIRLINDSYNANPISMEATINTLCQIAEQRKVAVLGAMLELGSRERQEHLDIGEFICQKDIDLLITVGTPGNLMAEGALKAGMAKEKVHSLENNQQAIHLLLNLLIVGDTVLIKGSRGVKMEEIVEGLLAQGE